MLFKALNNREKDKAERSYIYSHTTKHLNFTVKSKRSQSALEYMMTYGWAILIIVIVAVILYSMGIFNPSSSVTFTSSGFSPFTVSSSLCNNLGYKMAIIAGPMPNNANYITINKVFVTSATGANTTTASYTLTNPVTLKSGQSTTILIPNVACTAANVHYSLSAKIQYSYTASTLGLQTINTTGTVAGTSITGKPSTLTTYEPITITNTQSSATPNPFQQMVNFTSADPGFSSIATGNFGQNVEFFYYNGTVIPSWLENYTSTNAIWWLKIAAIPAGSSETVYVGFAPTLTNLFNTVNDGEAPQLTCSNPSDTASCSTYAEYDNGANVFNYYEDFAGTSLPSNFLCDYSANPNLYTPSDTLCSSVLSYIKVNNGLSLYTNSTSLLVVYFNLINSGYNLSLYGVLIGSAPFTLSHENLGISLTAGVPGPTFGIAGNNTNFESAPPPYVLFSNTGQEDFYMWMSNQTLSGSVYNVVGNFMVGSTLKSIKLNSEFVNNPSEVWGYQLAELENNGWGQDYYYIAITKATQVIPSVSFGSVA
jgi:hypothetical protein